MLVQSGDDVVAIAPDGRRTRLLTRAGDAAYSPDGTLVGFSRDGDLWLANADGSGQRRLTTTPHVSEWGPVWTPDGKALAYTAQADDGTTAIDVDDGTTQVQVGAAGGQHPVWSPGGTRIAFDDGAGARSSVAADGTDLRGLGAGRPLDWHVVPIGKPLFPNLVQRPPSGLVIMRATRGHWLLGFTSMVDNRGPGALWITAHRIGSAAVMQVQQRVHLRGGGVRTLP